MKVVIFAGGRGTSLGQLTVEKPKPMLFIGNRPIIWHVMKIYASQGYNDFIVCTGYLGNVIKDFFSDLQEDWRVHVVDTGLNALKGARLKLIEEFLDPGTHMMTYSDGLADVNVQHLQKFHESHGKLVTVTGIHPVSRFGEIKHENGKVTSFKEKPLDPERVVNGGFMVFETAFLDYLTANIDCDLEKGVLEQVAADGEMMVHVHDGSWKCLDTPRDLKELRREWQKGNPSWKM
ncbi:NTP transferase domain-containing protein [Candidatus Bathyarchaeota archaeon]|nr:NTP transferase domain-containing protein [Candidatus Bathyarchaeota archaeon]